jgi:hypothetical protein
VNAPAEAQKGDVANDTVYVTKTGKKYRGAGCRSLVKSSTPMKLKDAAARYSPCSVCALPAFGSVAEATGLPLTVGSVRALLTRATNRAGAPPSGESA